MTNDAPTPATLAEWLDSLAGQLPAGTPGASAAEQAAILELARVAAHASERIAAPISAYVAGIALAGRSPLERAAALRQLVAALEG